MYAAALLPAATDVAKTTSGTTSNYATNLIGVSGIEGRNQSVTTGFFIKDMHGDIRYAFNSCGTKTGEVVSSPQLMP